MPVYKDSKRGTWYFKVNKKGEQYVRRGFDTKRDAQTAEAEFKLHGDTGTRSAMTFKRLSTLFLDMKKSRIKETAVYDTASLINRQIMPYFDNKRVDGITSRDITTWMKKLTSKGYSSAYKSKAFYVFKSILSFGYKQYDMPENPFLRVDTFRKSTENKMINFWTTEEVSAFLSVIDNYELKTLYTTLLDTGMRLGEIQALSIGDVDLDKDKISIRHTWVAKPAKVNHDQSKRKQDPKTYASSRTITITDDLSRLLKEYKAYLVEKYNAADTDFLFGVSSPFSSSHIERMKNRYCKIAGVKQIKIHEFRHTWASKYVQVYGVTDINAISRHLGHSDTKMTLNTYSHMFPDAEENMIKRDKKS